MARDATSRRTAQQKQPSMPSHKQQASGRLARMALPDHAGESPQVNVARDQIRDGARAMVMQIVSFAVTEDPIPDSAFDEVLQDDIRRISQISSEMHARPQAHVAALETLVAKYPRIPMLRNHLACALDVAGEHDRANRLITELVREFPTYVFAICSQVMRLIADDRMEEARVLIETGPRGPLFVLTAVDPAHDVFHVSEVIAHTAMVGHYMLATDRPEAAEVQLEALKSVAPRSKQTERLSSALKHYKDNAPLLQALTRMKLDAEKRAARRRAKQAKNSPDTSE